MTKLTQIIFLAIVVVVIITAAAPALSGLTHALIPFIATLVVCIALLRAVWFFTR